MTLTVCSHCNHLVNQFLINQNLIYFPAGAFGVRHVQAFLVFLGLTLAYALRVNLSVAIVAMTDNSSNPNYQVSFFNFKLKFGFEI